MTSFLWEYFLAQGGDWTHENFYPKMRTQMPTYFVSVDVALEAPPTRIIDLLVVRIKYEHVILVLPVRLGVDLIAIIAAGCLRPTAAASPIV